MLIPCSHYHCSVAYYVYELMFFPGAVAVCVNAGILACYDDSTPPNRNFTPHFARPVAQFAQPGAPLPSGVRPAKPRPVTARTDSRRAPAPACTPPRVGAHRDADIPACRLACRPSESSPSRPCCLCCHAHHLPPRARMTRYNRLWRAGMRNVASPVRSAPTMASYSV